MKFIDEIDQFLLAENKILNAKNDELKTRLDLTEKELMKLVIADSAENPQRWLNTFPIMLVKIDGIPGLEHRKPTSG